MGDADARGGLPEPGGRFLDRQRMERGATRRRACLVSTTCPPTLALTLSVKLVAGYRGLVGSTFGAITDLPGPARRSAHAASGRVLRDSHDHRSQCVCSLRPGVVRDARCCDKRVNFARRRTPTHSARKPSSRFRPRGRRGLTDPAGRPLPKQVWSTARVFDSTTRRSVVVAGLSAPSRCRRNVAGAGQFGPRSR